MRTASLHSPTSNREKASLLCEVHFTKQPISLKVFFIKNTFGVKMFFTKNTSCLSTRKVAFVSQIDVMSKQKKDCFYCLIETVLQLAMIKILRFSATFFAIPPGFLRVIAAFSRLFLTISDRSRSSRTSCGRGGGVRGRAHCARGGGR